MEICSWAWRSRDWALVGNVLAKHPLSKNAGFCRENTCGCVLFTKAIWASGGRECEGPSHCGRWEVQCPALAAPALPCASRVREVPWKLAVWDLSACYKGYVLVFSSWKRSGRSLVCSSLESSQVLIVQDVSQVFIPAQPQVSEQCSTRGF